MVRMVLRMLNGLEGKIPRLLVMRIINLENGINSRPMPDSSELQQVIRRRSILPSLIKVDLISDRGRKRLRDWLVKSWG